jgi:hypothetical protein
MIDMHLMLVIIAYHCLSISTYMCTEKPILYDVPKLSGLFYTKIMLEILTFNKVN